MKYKKKGIDPFLIHYNHKREIENLLDCFRCTATRNDLRCIGYLQPIPEVEVYKVQIIFRADEKPKVFIKTPEVKYDIKAHMYKDSSLCLYYPVEFKWTNETSIVKFLIPWINEWIIYYEIYKLNGGVWIGPEAPHSLIK